MINWRYFTSDKKGEVFFETREEMDAYADELLKQEVLERIGVIMQELSRCYEFAREADTTQFLIKTFSLVLEASIQIKEIKSRCNFDGALDE